MPHLELPSTAGREVTLDHLGPGRAVLYIYPMTGQPRGRPPEGWNAIPGARGCTPETCGLAITTPSSRPPALPPSTGCRLRAPTTRPSSPTVRGSRSRSSRTQAAELADALDLPTFTAGDQRLYARLTLIIADGRIEHVFIRSSRRTSTPPKCSPGFPASVTTA